MELRIIYNSFRDWESISIIDRTCKLELNVLQYGLCLAMRLQCCPRPESYKKVTPHDSCGPFAWETKVHLL